MLAPNTLGGDQRPHFSICGFDGLNQRVGVGGDIEEWIPHLCLFAFHILDVVVYECVALPVCGAADFAFGTAIFEAREKPVKLRIRIPPDYDQVIESTGGTIRVSLAKQSCSARPELAMGSPLTLAAIREPFTGLHGFHIVPVPGKGVCELRHFSCRC